MIRQRPVGSAPVVQGIAEQLPFNDHSFDVAMAVLTVHHWSDADAGLAEMRRVSARQLVVTWDSAIFASRFWLVRDYLPEAVQRERHLATLKKVQDYLQPATSQPLLVPFDCTDGFFAAYWRRPRAYLDPYVRKAISGLALLSQRIVEPAMYRLQSDIDSGRWHQRYADLLKKESLDLGYRIVLANQ